MKAKEACKISFDAIAVHVNDKCERRLKEFNSILYDIEQQAKAGNFESTEIKIRAWKYKQKLKDLGYKVELEDNHWVIISWGHINPKDILKMKNK